MTFAPIAVVSELVVSSGQVPCGGVERFVGPRGRAASRFGNDSDCSADDASSVYEGSSCCDLESSICATHEDDGDDLEYLDNISADPPLLTRQRSQPDLQVSVEEVGSTYRQWREDLVELTGQAQEVVEELLLANVRDHGWNTGEHLAQVLLVGNEIAGDGEDVVASTSRRAAAFARARIEVPASVPACHSSCVDSEDDGKNCDVPRPKRRRVCVVCQEEDADEHLVPVSAVCGHRLHDMCLAAGLRAQFCGGNRTDEGSACAGAIGTPRFSAAVRLRCPACPVQRSSPVPPNVVRKVLDPAECAPCAGAEEERWLQAAHGVLFCTCPAGICRVRPARTNCSMQVVCSCAETHRFCGTCGGPPHEPVPCAHMIEVQSMLADVRQELKDSMAVPQRDLDGSSESDRSALAADLDGRPAMRDCFTASAGAVPVAQLSTLGEATEADAPFLAVGTTAEGLLAEYASVLGGRAQGALRQSAEIALDFLRSWGLQLAMDEASGVVEQNKMGSAGVKPSADVQGSSERAIEATTRPCPRCFIPIQRDGGCQHMSCTNPACRHEFCWLCLSDWRSAAHDGLTCAMRHSDNRSHESVMASVARRLQSNYEMQPVESRKPREVYDAEVRKRFEVALNTEVQGDRELMIDGDGASGLPLHLSVGLLEFYERQERKAREAAAVLTRSEATTLSSSLPSREALDHAAAAALHEFLAWLRPRWWLMLEIEDAAPIAMHRDAHRHPSQTNSELVRIAVTRTEHAVYCARRREVSRRLAGSRDAVIERLLTRLTRGGSPEGSSLSATRALLTKLVAQEEAAVLFEKAELPSVSGAASRALALGRSASRSWRTNAILEQVGTLRPMLGDEGRTRAVAGDHWADEVEERCAALCSVLEASADDESAWRQQVDHAVRMLDIARRSLFGLALEYGGGGRRGIERRRTER